MMLNARRLVARFGGLKASATLARPCVAPVGAQFQKQINLRFMSSNGNGNGEAGISKAREQTEVESDIPKREYDLIADATLDEIVDILGVLEMSDDPALEDVDINCSQGVLNINLGAPGFWVLNKQSPNRQVWWSSPLSGPRRFELKDASPERIKALSQTDAPVEDLLSCWVCTKHNVDLLSSLRAELQIATGVDILEE